MTYALRSMALLGLFACATDPDQAGSSDPADTEPVVSTDGTTEVPVMPRGVPTLAPSELDARVDTAVVRCNGDDGTVSVDVVGQADRVEIDLVHNTVTRVTMTRASTDEAEVWRTYEGTAPCSVATNATMVIRSFRGDTEFDCAVFGPQTDETLAGANDDMLEGASRPSAADCHGLSGH